MKVGIFGSEYQIERQNLIKRLFEKLREQEADIYVDSPFYTFLTDAFGFEPVVSGLLVGDEFDLDIALSWPERYNPNPRQSRSLLPHNVPLDCEPSPGLNSLYRNSESSSGHYRH